MRRVILAVAFLCLVSSAVFAQSPCSANCSVFVGQTFGAAAAHDGLNTTGYRVYLDGVKLGNDLPLSTLQSGTVTVATLVGPPRGSHTLQFGAFNLDGELKSDPVTFTSKTPLPNKPGPVQILISLVTAEDGTMQFRIVGIDPAVQ